MIYTLTLAPCVDLYAETNKNVPEFKNMNNLALPGGKGIGESIIFNNLGVKNICISLVGGATGKYIEDQVKSLGVETDFIHINQPTRVNMKIHHKGQELEVNGPHPLLNKNICTTISNKLLKLKKGDLLIVGGNIPKTLDLVIAKKTLNTLIKRGVKFIIDTQSMLMLEACKFKPLMIKPNNHELAKFFNVKIKSDKDTIKYSRKLIDLGAQSVLVSMGVKGAMFITKDKVIKKPAVKVDLISTVGCGDSMLAGFVYGYKKYHNVDKALSIGITTGAATAASKGLANKVTIQKFLKKYC